MRAKGAEMGEGEGEEGGMKGERGGREWDHEKKMSVLERERTSKEVEWGKEEEDRRGMTGNEK